ncbi:PAS domain-containing protein [Streptomyces sp. 891-h]|uniref:helix-turn-helix transcriptional regulator n=1 Tax=Streptomyces sp. 891-h TaxID=2720714 RepID=UPI001FAA5173|nr:PAS domain-containing protein [Streptomyces sp. 891-h]UNZ22010.1 transcriptional regulator [Streptomyces sp. 891-h]
MAEDDPHSAARSSPEDEVLLREAEKIVTAIGRMFPGLCEAVLHDLRHPDHAVRTVENNLSGRRTGDPATELGLARIADPAYPEVLQNYPNRFPDGRPAKSTSIGIKNGEGTYVAAVCLNLDVSLLSTLNHGLTELLRTQEHRPPVHETLHARTVDELRTVTESFAAARGTTPRALTTTDRTTLVRTLKDQGFLELKGAVRTLTGLLGVSRATVYNDLRR